ncbi:MAG: gamma-glutamylcyclotransferase [Bacteroidetes bacterium]|nr:MAG: gamma-glutamylcyclotransferase [Bacteroidota bacterium]
MLTKLFVYGSLKRGFHNPYALQLHHQARFWSEGKLRGLLLDLGEYPALVPQSRGTQYVYGEIFELGDQVHQLLANLDYYEGFDPQNPDSGAYKRERLVVESSYGPTLCWAYTYNSPWQELAVVPGGNWPG